MKIFPKIVIGHNNFFGVDHLSKSRGKERYNLFSKIENVENIIDYCIKNGAEGIMLSTHTRSKEILNIIKNKNIKIYPLLPYLQKYVTTANNKGIIGTIQHFLYNEKNLTDNIILTASILKNLFTFNEIKIFNDLISTELKNFKNMDLGCIFLHDGLVDICLALDQKEIILSYIDYIEKNYNCYAGFATKNFPTLIKKFKNWGIDNPKIMSHINNIGFNMNPSKEEFEKTLITNNFNFMAMSSLASGHANPIDTYKYIGLFKKVESICVGISSKEHVLETYGAIKKYI